MGSPQVQESDVRSRARGPFFPRWLQMKAAADYCDMKPCYFYKLNTLGLGPPTIGKGRGKRAHTDDLDKWLRERGGEGA